MFHKFPKPYLFLILAIFLGVLVLIFERPTTEKEGDILHQAFLEKLDVNQIFRIEIEKLMNGIQLKKENNLWKVALLKSNLLKWFEADGEKIELMLSTLLDTQITSLSGNNPQKHGSFEVGVTGLQVRLFDNKGKTLAHFIVGKTGPSFTENYIRKEGENSVYLTDRYLKTHFPPDLSAWRSHTIWNIAPNQIEAVHIKHQKREWKIEKGEFFAKIAKISAHDFDDISLEEAGLNPPETILNLTTKTRVFTLKIGRQKKGTGLFFAAKEGSEEIYLVSEELVKTISNSSQL